jgi:hypothetical protein
MSFATIGMISSFSTLTSPPSSISISIIDASLYGGTAMTLYINTVDPLNITSMNYQYKFFDPSNAWNNEYSAEQPITYSPSYTITGLLYDTCYQFKVNTNIGTSVSNVAKTATPLWKIYSTVDTSASVNSLAANSSGSTMICSATNSTSASKNGLYISTNGGNTFSKVSTGSTSGILVDVSYIHKVAISSNGNTKAFCGSEGSTSTASNTYIYVSIQDNSWVKLPSSVVSTTGFFNNFQMSPNGNIIMASHSNIQTYRITLNMSNLVSSTVSRIDHSGNCCFASLNPSLVITSRIPTLNMPRTFKKSLNGGTTWSDISTNIVGSSSLCMSEDGKYVYIQSGGPGSIGTQQNLDGRRMHMSASYGDVFSVALNNNSTSNTGVASKDGEYAFFSNSVTLKKYGQSTVSVRKDPSLGLGEASGLAITSNNNVFASFVTKGHIYKLY